MNFEDYSKYLIVDLEATCSNDNSIERSHMEIIEIGAVMVQGQTLEIVDEFQTFIRPVRTPKLTAFCTELTSITQTQVDNAPTFADAASEFRAWLTNHSNFAFCSWGDYDKNQIETDRSYHDETSLIEAQHFNIKNLFSEALGIKKRLGMAKALRRVGIALEGTHHRGIDDARNMAKLMPFILSRT